MIVKIARYNRDQDWWIIDNVRKISISKQLYKRPQSEQNSDTVIWDINTDCTCVGDEYAGWGDACSNCVKFLRLICRLNNGDEYAIDFDTTAYILNDDGKTIEKIVANYND